MVMAVKLELVGPLKSKRTMVLEFVEFGLLVMVGQVD